MTVLWGRQIVVNVAGLVITGPRITFRVEHHSDDTGSNSRIVLYNLSPNRRGQIHDRLGDVCLQAGHQADGGYTTSIIMEGSIQEVTQERSDLAHKVILDVGDRTRGRLRGVTSRSYSGQNPIRQVAKDLAADLGLPISDTDLIPAAATVTNWAFSGVATDGLTEVLRRAGCTWHDANGVLWVNRPGVVNPDAPVVSVNPDSGLVGIPSTTDEGGEVTMLLNPLVTVGGILEVNSRTNPGRWKVVHVIHEGDDWPVHGGRFVTHAELRPIE